MFYKSIFYNYLRPNMVYESVYDIDYELLRDDGIKHLFFDIDNTLISYKENGVSLECLNLFNSLSTMGFENIILISNNSSTERVEKVAKQLKLPAISFACKPFVFTMRRIVNDYNVPVNESVLVGDQLLTDVLLANTMGMSSIFVDPIERDGVSFFRLTQYRLQDKFLAIF